MLRPIATQTANLARASLYFLLAKFICSSSRHRVLICRVPALRFLECGARAPIFMPAALRRPCPDVPARSMIVNLYLV